MKSKKIIFIIVLCVFIFSLYQKNKNEKNQVENTSLVVSIEELNQENFDRDIAALDRVVDGDTLVVFLNGERERVRLVGVNTPESTTEHREIECFGQESSNFVKNILNRQKNIFIEYDDVAGQRDRHGRILAHVFLENGENLNNKIISEGYGYEYTYRGQNYKYKQQYKEAQKNAKENQRGLWQKNVCI